MGEVDWILCPFCGKLKQKNIKYLLSKSQTHRRRANEFVR